MLRSLSKQTVLVLLVLVVIFLVILLYHQQVQDYGIVLEFRNIYFAGQNPKAYLVKYLNLIIVPRNLPKEQIKLILKENPKLADYRVTSDVAKQKPIVDQQQSSYHKHNITIYDTTETKFKRKGRNCGKIQQEITLQIDEASHLQIDIRDLLNDIVDQIEAGTSHYLQDIADFFYPWLKLQLKHDVAHKYWFRMAGSSVWLEEYGIHYMISRIIYSPNSVKNHAKFSLVYAQAYDVNWNELKNTTLVVPSNEGFKAITLPSIVPVPFHYDLKNMVRKYWGPEDALVTLVRNKAGYDEPVLIFNAFHRKFPSQVKDKYGKKKPEFYRTLFLSWPWQDQKGKEMLDGESNELYTDKTYSRTLSLTIKSSPFQKLQKNWVPIVLQQQRLLNGYDKDILLVYRWANLEILQCLLESGECEFEFRMDDKLPLTAEVGPLRGGTQMLSVNELIASTGTELSEVIPPNREIWVGFRRAHIKRCGCGERMYRPNLVVISKDQIDNQNVYKISHISSYITFDMPIVGWDLENPREVCGTNYLNILISSGISTWNINALERDSDGIWRSEDYLTLMLSTGDYTVSKVNIKGLLDQVLQIDNPTLFIKNATDENPTGRASEASKDKDLANSNDNIDCAIASSWNFCSRYGKFIIRNPDTGMKELFNSINHFNDSYHKMDYEQDVALNMTSLYVLPTSTAAANPVLPTGSAAQGG